MRVAIVGGGPTAVAMMESIARARDIEAPEAVLDVSVFEPSPHPWSGRSFAPDRPEALSNTYTSDMSVRQWEPQHVDDWFRAEGHSDLAGHSFAPRSLIGRYFREAARNVSERMSAFALIPEQVIAVDVDDAGVRLDTRSGRHLFDYLVLCIGRGSGVDPFGLTGQRNVCADPYPLQDALHGVDPDERIGIVGCGLTAIDLVAALRADRHRGQITLMSRRGLLPAVRPAPLAYDLRYFTVDAIEAIVAAQGELTLQNLVELACRELDHAGASRSALSKEIFPNRYGIDRLKYQLDHVNDGDIAYSIAIKMLSAFQDAWYLLRVADKEILLGYRHIYNSLCCPMPQHRAQELCEMGNAGAIEVVRGLQSVTSDEHGGFVAATGDGLIRRFDRVYSAVSDGNMLSPLALPLVDSLLRAGHAWAHPFGGLEIDRATSCLLDQHHNPQPRLYAIGALTNGAFQVLNGFIVLRRRTTHVADAIVAHYRANRGRHPAWQPLHQRLSDDEMVCRARVAPPAP